MGDSSLIVLPPATGKLAVSSVWPVLCSVTVSKVANACHEGLRNDMPGGDIGSLGSLQPCVDMEKRRRAGGNPLSSLPSARTR